MKIEIKSLSLTNFKGIRSLKILFDAVTNIFGDNATGKTTLMDAFLWLLFDKDSSERTAFAIKTLDENNIPFHHLDHEVEACLIVDGSEIVLKKSMREDWVKKRGSTTPEFKGHTNAFFWNDVPMKKEEYQANIAQLVNENLFRLITNTTYFNNLKWQERRAVLMQIAGVINDIEILASIQSQISSDHFNTLLNAIKQQKNKENFKMFRAELAAKKKKLKDELETMPTRIEEANRALPEEKNYKEIEILINDAMTNLDTTEGLLTNKSKAAKEHEKQIGDLIQRRQGLNRLLMDIEFNIKNQVQQGKQQRDQNILNEKNELRILNDKVINARKDYTNNENRKETLQKEQTSLREKWGLVDAEKLEFQEGQFCCPACKREYEASDIEAAKQKLTANFNTDKSKRLKEITDRGVTIGNEIKDIDTRLGNLTASGKKLNEEITIITNRITNLEEENVRLSGNDEGEIQKAIATHAQYQQYKQEVVACNDLIDKPFTAEDNSALLLRKKELTTQLSDLNTQLAGKAQREKQLARIKELEAQEKTMSNELASLEGIEFSVELFVKANMDELENRINNRFKLVRFKMFEEQINGGRNEACTTLINGVPYADANTASKIQAGLDIINTLSEHYDVQAPVWVDNRESVVHLQETPCQLINLIVSEADKKLRISTAHQLQQVA